MCVYRCHSFVFYWKMEQTNVLIHCRQKLLTTSSYHDKINYLILHILTFYICTGTMLYNKQLVSCWPLTDYHWLQRTPSISPPPPPPIPAPRIYAILILKYFKRVIELQKNISYQHVFVIYWSHSMSSTARKALNFSCINHWLFNMQF